MNNLLLIVAQSDPLEGAHGVLLFSGLIIVAGLIQWVILMLVAVGIAYSPVAAIKSWRYASKRNSNATKYAFHGALYSALMLVPWFYLRSLLEGNGVSRKALKCGYLILFVPLWIFGLIPLAGFQALVNTGPLGNPNTGTAASIVLFASVGALIVSAGALMWRGSIDRRRDGCSASNVDALPSLVYIMPVVCLVVLDAATLTLIALDVWNS